MKEEIILFLAVPQEEPAQGVDGASLHTGLKCQGAWVGMSFIRLIRTCGQRDRGMRRLRGQRDSSCIGILVVLVW